MIYEERRYDVSPAGKAGYRQVFKNVFIPLITKHGAKLIGWWETEFGNRNEFICLLAWDDLAQRTKAFEGLRQEEQIIKIIPTLPCNNMSVGILQPLEPSPLK